MPIPTDDVLLSAIVGEDGAHDAVNEPAATDDRVGGQLFRLLSAPSSVASGFRLAVVVGMADACWTPALGRATIGCRPLGEDQTMKFIKIGDYAINLALVAWVERKDGEAILHFAVPGAADGATHADHYTLTLKGADTEQVWKQVSL